jgi:hypothetical protein
MFLVACHHSVMYHKLIYWWDIKPESKFFWTWFGGAPPFVGHEQYHKLNPMCHKLGYLAEKLFYLHGLLEYQL